MSDPQTTPAPPVSDTRISEGDFKRLEKLMKAGTKPDSPPSSSVADPSADDKVKKELDELATYRENERQALLKKLPKKVIEEFKLKEESLVRVKEISTLTQTLRKRSVGIDTPPPNTEVKEKKFQWNPDTQKNEMC